MSLRIVVITDVANDHPLDILRSNPDYFGVWPCGIKERDFQKASSPLATFRRGNENKGMVKVRCSGCSRDLEIEDRP